VKSYVGFVDPSGGSADSMTLAVAHADGSKVVLDGAWEVRPPFSPESVVAEFSSTLKRYGIGRVVGDRYGGEWPRERFRLHGISYEPCGQTKSELYVEFLALANSGRVELPNHRRLLAQLQRLERRATRGGRESIDHAPGGHDDLANAVAGALVLASHTPRVVAPLCTFISPENSERYPGCGPERWWRKIS
jgi:hypothetical protein